MNRVFDIKGRAGVTLRWFDALLNAAITLPQCILSPPEPTLIHFSAATTAFIKNVLMTGGTSGATFYISDYIITSGSLGGGDARGVAFIRSVSGVWQLGENIVNAASATVGVARSLVITIPGGKETLQAQYLHMLVEGNSIRECHDGDVPTNTSAGRPGWGELFAANDTLDLAEENDLQRFSIINNVSGTLATVTATVYF